MSAEPNRRAYASTVAAAYANQYHPDRRFRCRVMGDAVVIYNHAENEFYYQSSLTPLEDDEVAIETIEEGVFGDTGTRQVRRQIESYVLERDDLWQDVLDRIRQDAAERAEHEAQFADES